MDTNTQHIMEQIVPYQPWLFVIGVLVLFVTLRMTRKALRRRVDTIGRRILRERGPLIWFWLNARGVMIHELSHALTDLFFRPFGFRITSITLFRIQPLLKPHTQRQTARDSRPQSLQLGEVQYVRPKGRIMSYVGDGLSGVAPLIGGTLAFILLYWVATGYSLWDFPPFDISTHQLRILRPGWPWWTLLFAPYLILTITSELWPSRQDWYNARWFVIALVLLLLLILTLLWYTHNLLPLIPGTVFIASHIDFALLTLLVLDLIFLFVAEMLVRVIR